ncbi:MAG TPA: 1-(5-phosphoribosyl)-5-[(5-phosphoribosylamino)methylideneamino] imidazole-4-carboxamide isomerase [Spirochaetia bacterium]|nr:1-(5-phosphoribosyl)-5-[(5-phosphoribosylamino)methylideneamino] imidazole-4-carboxamide isomerase [Spirochaetia bacterium]
MLLVPAIDLRAGRCVRLLQGSFSDVTSYSADPVDTARGFESDGARWIHVVDLDAAEGRGADNLGVIQRIRRAITCRMEVGGGIRSLEAARAVLDLGVDRLVVGTLLVRNPREVSRWAELAGPRFAAGVDARDGRVRISGWTEEAARADTDVAAELASLGMRWLIYTSISRDGTLAGPDVARTSAVARAAGLPTIVSGGVGAPDHVEAVARCGEPLIAGVILGKAVYEGRLSVRDLARRYPQADHSAWDA